MARIHWFIHACAITLAAVTWLFNPIAAFAREIADWPLFHPSPTESIALDVAARTEVDDRQPGIAARFVAFAKRALTHTEFSAGHFDLGRMPA